MEERSFYLKQNIQVEPLYNKWYAWVHLIAPATAAMNVVHRYINIMASYVNSPEMHAIAVKNPAMKGGPFVDLQGKYVEEVKYLEENTRSKCSVQFEFVNAIKQLNDLLKNKAKGFSLEPLYKDVPEILRGYVELAYDLNNVPSFRFYEPLLYRSPFHITSSQSIALSEINKDGDRPFILSTPRLESEDVVHLPIPFNHRSLDTLFKMKRVAGSYEEVKLELDVPQKREPLFRSFFTEKPPAPYNKYTGDKMRIRYFGHACILIETKDISILLDPVLSYTYEADITRYTYADLPEVIDYVLITHSHQDHILLETILQLKHKIGTVVVGRNLEGVLQDPSLKLALESVGVKNIIEIREFEEIHVPNGMIMGIPFIGEHHDLLIHSKSCFLIRIGDRSVLCVADSCNIEHRLYDHVHQIVGDVDILFLGMECDGAPASWVYGPLFNEPLVRECDRSRRGRGCNFKEGIYLVNKFNCKEVYVYAMGFEPWLRYILDVQYTDQSNPIVQSNMLLENCHQRNILAERLFGEKEI